MVLTPGCRTASDVQSRPFRGNSRTVSDSTWPESAEEVRSICGAASVTCTVVVVSPTLRERFNCCCCPTESATPDCTAVANPAAETLTSYTPGVRFGALNKPAESVLTERA